MDAVSDSDVPMSCQPLDQAVLGQLLVVQSTMAVLPDAAGLLAFLCRALENVPGVACAQACYKGQALSRSQPPQTCTGCDYPASNPAPPATRCPLPQGADTLSLAMRTLDHHFGFCNIEIADASGFFPYEAHIRNLVSHAATLLENRSSSSLLRQQAGALEQARAELEQRVELRTAELAVLNQTLEADVAARAVMESALRESRERYRNLVEATSDWVWEIDEHGLYSYVGSQCRDILGYEPEYLLGKTPFELMPKEEAARVRPIFLEAATARQPLRQIENTNIRSDGRLVVLETSGVPRFNAEGAFLGYRGIDRDVSERIQQQREFERSHVELALAYKRLEDTQGQLLQSEKMASIGQLAAGVAHEINNPIGYVSSNLGTLEEYLDILLKIVAAYERSEARMPKGSAVCAEVEALRKEADLPYIKQDLVALVEESKEGLARVKKIVQDLKDFSHAGAADEWQWASLHQGLDSTLNIVWNELKYKAEVVKNYGSVPDIECLPSQLNQVFLNLLVNAGQAIEERGRITIRTGMRGDQVFIEISDTGKGIPPENLRRIFDPFFTTKPVGKGTGLGLSLSYSIVQKHQGRIEVASAPGTGTTFTVLLPVAPDHPDARPCHTENDIPPPQP